ncbi:kinase-like protein, partial [Exidia glandulosa HHB12029]
MLDTLPSPRLRRAKGRLSNATPPVTPVKTRPRAQSQPGAPPTAGNLDDDGVPPVPPLPQFPLSPPYTPGRRTPFSSIRSPLGSFNIQGVLRSILPSRVFKSKSTTTTAPLTPDPSPLRQPETRPGNPVCGRPSTALDESEEERPLLASAQASVTSFQSRCAANASTVSLSDKVLVDDRRSSFSSLSTIKTETEESASLSSPVSLLSPHTVKSFAFDDSPVLVAEPESAPVGFSFPPTSPHTPRQRPTPWSSTSEDTPTPPARPAPLRRLGSTYSDHFQPEHVLCADFLLKYALNGEIGSGGYGFVLTAHVRTTGEEVAVKFVKKSHLGPEQWAVDPRNGGRLPVEAYLLLTLEHPSIISCLDVFEDGAYFYLVLELHGSPWAKHASPQNSPTRREYYRPNLDELDGEWQETNPNPVLELPEHLKNAPHLNILRPALCSRRPSQDLFECIEHNQLSEEEAQYVFAQIADAVLYMHERGVIHRDIKDENILIDRNLRVKLIDFGSAVQEDTTAPSPVYSIFYGTPTYASSEIMNRKLYLARPAEIWTLGILLCNIVWGCSPFVDDEAARTADMHLPRFFPNDRWSDSRA